METISEPAALEVYEWYADLEARLLEITRVVPFLDTNQAASIHSPRLASVHLEAASLIDTLFRSQLPDPFQNHAGDEVKRKRANIIDYHKIVNPGLRLESRKSLLLKGMPTLLSPFNAWANEDSHSPDWWQGYNKLKHDRLASAREISLLDCIYALCGLNQLMLSLNGIVQLVFRFGWADVAGYNPTEALKELNNHRLSHGYIAYTEFFAYFLNRVDFDSVAAIRPVQFRNSERLMSHLGRMASEDECK